MSRYKSIRTIYTREKKQISILFQEKSFTDIKHLTIEEAEQLTKNLTFILKHKNIVVGKLTD